MENQTRPTTEFTTEGGHTVVYKTYITGFEYEEIQAVSTDGVRSATLKTSKTGEQEIQNVDYTAINKNVKMKMIEMIVVSLDGSSDDLVNRVGLLPSDEYLEIIDRIDGVGGKKKATDTESPSKNT